MLSLVRSRAREEVRLILLRINSLVEARSLEPRIVSRRDPVISEVEGFIEEEVEFYEIIAKDIRIRGAPHAIFAVDV